MRTFEKIFIAFVVMLVILSCESHKSYEDYNRVEITLLDKSFRQYLKINNTVNTITYLNIYISGEINGTAEIRLYHYPFENFSKIIIEGKIDKKYRTDWYSDEMMIEYIPMNNLSGKNITIYYKLL